MSSKVLRFRKESLTRLDTPKIWPRHKKSCSKVFGLANVLV